MKKSILALSLIVIIFTIWSCAASKKDPGFVVGRDYEVKVLIDTALILDPQTGREVVKIHETQDTMWSTEIKK